MSDFFEELKEYTTDKTDNYGSRKYYMVYDLPKKQIVICSTHCYMGPIAYFKCYRDCMAAIRAIGYNRIIKYYFGQKEIKYCNECILEKDCDESIYMTHSCHSCK